jgi:ABC-type transport system involved in multi-copper enzyme maturation permease subunit
MLVGLFIAYQFTPGSVRPSINDLARVSERFAFALFLTQNLAIVVLAPAYLGSAIAEEKERRTLELLFTTQLSDSEIILGKLTSRIIHLLGFVVAGVPILCLAELWGGIDLLLIAGNILNTMLNILSIGSICLVFSVLCRSVAAAVMLSYAVILPVTLSCMRSMHGFPFVLQDARIGGESGLTVQHLGWLAIGHLVVTGICLILAVGALRETDLLGVGSIPPPNQPEPIPSELMPNPPASEVLAVLEFAEAAKRERKPLDFFGNPYALPPITGNPLLWKERYVGGLPWLSSPIVWAAMVPFLITGMLLYLEPTYTNETERLQLIVLFFYRFALGGYLGQIGFLVAGTVVREKQQQTLDTLLLLPIERRDILGAKLLASLLRGWPWLVMLTCSLTLGAAFGVCHPLSAVLLCLAAIPPILLVSLLGLLISVTAPTVLRANLAMIGFLTAIFCVTYFFWSPLAFGVNASSFARGDPRSLDTPQIVIAAGVMVIYLLTAAFCWTRAVARFENRTSSGA